MSFKESCRQGTVYLGLLYALTGCSQPKPIFPVEKVSVESISDVLYNKAAEAASDIVDILDKHITKKDRVDISWNPLQSYESGDLYCFAFNINERYTAHYFCYFRNGRFSRHAEEIALQISTSTNEYVEITFTGIGNNHVDPKKQLKVRVNRYRIEFDAEPKEGLVPRKKQGIT